jgi:hypothetical protein
MTEATVAIARGPEKAQLALELGAHIYLDSTTQDVAAELAALGGAQVILATAPSAPAMSSGFAGLVPNQPAVPPSTIDRATSAASGMTPRCAATRSTCARHGPGAPSPRSNGWRTDSKSIATDVTPS